MENLNVLKALHMVTALMIEKGRPLNEEELQLFKFLLVMAACYIDRKANELPF